ncbi:MAG: hypothetical protein FJW34_03545 [Acidobacteria bacterium]|nr:hypothetical protein [Acidobacteriota bacterium]
MSLADGEGGNVLVHCFGGCEQARVIDALRMKGLWPERERPAWTAAQRRDYARARREAKPLAQAALWWWRARLSELEDLKRECFHAGGVDLDRLIVVAPALLRLQNLSADGIVVEYLRARDADPHAARGLVRIGQAWERACKAVILACLTKREAPHAA